ncbi:MAG: hypothetical protein EOL88_04595 [Bacteroidia bacterium]|nr:hypothetical protein [Bacteroidia bacterium]
MILIADSGSTKTDWVLLDKNTTMAFVQTAGFNPYYSDTKVLKELITENVLKKMTAESIHSLFYYGSGCSTDSKKEHVSLVLKKYFPTAAVEVNHDLLGSARSILGHQPGIACILGTGSNSCKYDGERITENVPSVGYFFGDEGSGTDFGKRLINHYLRKNLPPEIQLALENETSLTFEKAMDSIYNQPMPNRFFSSFSPFILKNINHLFITDQVMQSFRDFFTYQVCNYSGYDVLPLCFVGSVAFHFRDLLEKVAAEFNLTIRKVIPNPVEGLIVFHQEPEEENTAE